MPTKNLTLSIVIPVYNEQHHLKACLDAIAVQTVKPDEVIMVDNNSTDKSVAIARSYQFVKVLREPVQGVVYARDRGFNAARSDLIGRIDADSILKPGWVHYVKRFYSEAVHENHALTGGGYFYNIRFPRITGWWQGQIAFRMNRLLMGHYILFGSNMVLPRKLWLMAKPTVCRRNDIHEDLDLAIHLHQLGYDITYRDSLKVGIKMKRVRSNRRELWANLIWWPQTLRYHGKWTWIFGWLGAAMLYLGSPLILAAEWIARLFGRAPLDE